MSTTTFTKEQIQEEFRAGVTAVLRSWSVLRTSVDSGWGGPQSQQKADILRQSIYDHLDGSTYPPGIDIIDFEDAIVIYMEEEFSITLEDGSEKQIADTIFRMYQECFQKGDPTLCRQIVEKAAQASEQIASYPVNIQANEHDDDDDDMEDVGVSVHAQAYAAESLFGAPAAQPQQHQMEPLRQLGEAAPVKPEPQLDDDGFAPVSTKKKKKKQPL